MSVPEENRQFPLLCSVVGQESYAYIQKGFTSTHPIALEVVGVDQLISLSLQISSVNREDNVMSS
jgi:hypothetical protein